MILLTGVWCLKQHHPGSQVEKSQHIIFVVAGQARICEKQPSIRPLLPSIDIIKVPNLGDG
jgi:hypothetical protein